MAAVAVAAARGGLRGALLMQQQRWSSGSGADQVGVPRVSLLLSVCPSLCPSSPLPVCPLVPQPLVRPAVCRQSLCPSACPSVLPRSPPSLPQLGELGKGAGKGGGGGGAIREAGGAFGKKQAAEEERYFR